jgi:hypothetical protein
MQALARPGRRRTGHLAKAAVRRTHADLAASKHARAMRISSALTNSFRRMYKPAAAMVTPEAVIRILNRAKVKFVLMGAHGISGWCAEPRATQDVDVLIQKRSHAPALKALQKAFPDLIVVDLPVVTRLLDPLDNQVVIDLMKPVEDLYAEAFQSAVAVGKSHRIPSLEVALACKYAAMASENREARKKALDEADFIGMAVRNYEQIKTNVLFSLGEMVKNGGGTEVLKLVEDAKAGRRLKM